jgi:hypothetical protein
MRIHIAIEHEGKEFGGEFELLPKRSTRPPGKAAAPTARVAQAKPTKPSLALAHLYNAEFFKVRRSLSETTRHLSQEGFHFNNSSVQMALQRAKFLQQKGTPGSYTYVQKYPPR